jgi:hypothetical protein
MPLRPANYKNISDLIKRRIELSFGQLLTATIELTDRFLRTDGADSVKHNLYVTEEK